MQVLKTKPWTKTYVISVNFQHANLSTQKNLLYALFVYKYYLILLYMYFNHNSTKFQQT